MAKTDRTIIYYTDNSLDQEVYELCKKQLLKAANGTPIISVSQKPIDLGKNICIGEIGRSHLSLFKQLTTGIMYATTKNIVIAEHDCMYTPDYVDWDPPQEDVFYYNNNQFFVEYGGKDHGLYSHIARRVLSQLICNRDLARKALMERIEILELGYAMLKGAAGACEPGILDDRAFVKQRKDLGKDPTKWKAEKFNSAMPNLDLRHGKNFSGNRTSKNQAWDIPYWGKFDEYIKRLMNE